MICLICKQTVLIKRVVMRNNKIVATISGCVQTGEESYKQVYSSRVFSDSCTIKDINDWAVHELGIDIEINDIMFSMYTGEER